MVERPSTYEHVPIEKSRVVLILVESTSVAMFAIKDEFVGLL